MIMRNRGRVHFTAVTWIYIFIASFQGFGAESDAEIDRLIKTLLNDSVATSVTDTIGLTTCGESNRKYIRAKEITQKLIDKGAGATPRLQNAITKLYISGGSRERSPSANWLLYAFAAVAKANSLQLLRGIVRADLNELEGHTLDQAFAIAMDLTSYVTIPQKSMRRFHCRRLAEPKDTLEALIIALGNGDLPQIEALVTDPTQRRGVQDWPKYHDSQTILEFSEDIALQPKAAGFRFIEGEHIADVGTLSASRSRSNIIGGTHSIVIGTYLVDDIGNPCAFVNVEFFPKSSDYTDGLSYFIASEDLDPLVSGIVKCAQPVLLQELHELR